MSHLLIYCPPSSKMVPGALDARPDGSGRPAPGARSAAPLHRTVLEYRLRTRTGGRTQRDAPRDAGTQCRLAWLLVHPVA